MLSQGKLIAQKYEGSGQRAGYAPQEERSQLTVAGRSGHAAGDMAEDLADAGDYDWHDRSSEN